MAVLSITLTGSTRQLISGIPQVVSITTSAPSLIFYTLDGTVPTTSSFVYVAPIELPGEISIRLRVYAVSGALTAYSDVTYSTNSVLLTSPRRIDSSGIGITVDGFTATDVFVDGYELDSSNSTTVPARSHDKELVDYDLIFSKTGPGGEGDGTLISIGYPDPDVLERQYSAVEESPSSPNNNNVNFNPRSLFVQIDGRDGYSDQSVLIINRPYGSTMDLKRYYNGASMYNPEPYVSGGLLRPIYDKINGEAYFPYWDSNELRWVISRQSFDVTNSQNFGLSAQTGNPLVFKWIYGKRSSL
jgi:hypothetical protein